MRQSIDLVGHKYGKLLVCDLSDKTHIDNRGKLVSYWNCLCDCGCMYTASGGNLRRKNRPTTQCRECGYTNTKKQVFSGTRNSDHPLYKTWKVLRARVKRESSYLRKGIKVCKEWDSFLSFAEWGMSQSIPEEFEIDRIDNDGDYEPSNCQFLTPCEHRIKTVKDRCHPSYKKGE